MKPHDKQEVILLTEPDWSFADPIEHTVEIKEEPAA